ncbi:MAG: Lrp/AsnC family transcriptional regulator [Verrucomicrobia bacterium]|nr:Lrp/AsnC family transcriptional regulator [Verrucomicrobiota bacterium]
MDPLLQILQRDARASREDIAAQLDLSVAEVEARIAKLEADGVILGYRAVVDAEKVPDAGVQAVIEVRLTPEREGGFDRIAERVAKFDQVQACYLMSGGYDLIVFIEARTLREIASFVAEKLSPLGGVQSTATHFRLKTYKEHGIVLGPGAGGGGQLAVSP